MDYQSILQKIYEKIQPYAKEGKQTDYIPALAEVNPDQFGIFLSTVHDAHYQLGDYSTRFSIQSISKVFTLAKSLHLLGHDLWNRIGKEPSGSAFNSLVQLEYEDGKPCNLVGLPGKSGVGGGIVAIYPSKYSIAVWSPRLNEKGNSVLGMKALELFTTETIESIF